MYDSFVGLGRQTLSILWFCRLAPTNVVTNRAVCIGLSDHPDKFI